MSVIKNVPFHLRDDCYQAACLGLTIALMNKDKAKSFNSYAFACMKSEVLKELAELAGPLSLDKTTFLLLHKYKKALANGEELNISESRKKNLDKLHRMYRIPLGEIG